MRKPMMLTEALRALGSQQALAVALAVAALVVVALPLPALVVDLLLALSMGMAVGTLVVALMSPAPARLASLPATLVLGALARIALCLCVSRLILSTGEGGALTSTLGNVLSGGDAIAGLGLLVALAVIQLVMITAGVGRMSEVAARFALDAMPGRQMALDTAVGRGQVSADEARETATGIEQEASFYGAMDGAGRLLRGEAVATVAIVALTAIAGGIRGASDSADIGATASHFALLAVGQGLVIILPALVASAAAAIVVTRSASRSGLLQQTGDEMLVNAWPLVAGAVALLAVGLAPGVAKVPVLIAAGALGVGAWRLRARTDAPPEPDRQSATQTSELLIETGLGLLDIIEGPEGLAAQVVEARHELNAALGFPMPPTTVSDSIDLRATEFTVSFRGATIAQGIVRPQRVLALPPSAGAAPDVGRPGELADGRAGVWVTSSQARSLASVGYELLTPVAVIVADMQVAVRRRAAELFDLETATRLFEAIERGHPAVVRAARGAGLTAALLRQVGGRLLECCLPMRDPLAVIEALVEGLAESTDPETLAFACRPRLAGMISAGVAPQGRVRALELAPELQQELVDCVHRSETGAVAALPPERLATWVDALDDLGREYAWGQALVVMCEPRALPALAHLCARTCSELIALTSSDLTPTVTVEFVARLTPDLLA
jgi:flagellar biosynthesis protein FlhA